MTIDDKIKDEKLPYDNNREAAEISALLSGKIDKYKYLTGEGIIEQANFTYFPLGKAFEKQIKTIEEQGKKQVEALEVLKPEENKEDVKSAEGLFPKWIRTNEIKNEIDEFKKMGRKN